MNNRRAGYVSVLILSLFFLSFRWPVNSGRLTSSFGESRGDHYHDGIDLVCPDDRIFPVAAGRLLYYWDKSLFPLDNEPGGGNFMVLQHEKDICSVYMHLDQGAYPAVFADERESLATVGNSGHSFSKHLHFSLLDRKARESRNPLSVLPACDDKMKPVIGAMYLKIGEKYIQIREKSDIRLTRHWPILVDITDTVTGKEKLGVYNLKASFNGEQVCDVKFDKISFSREGLRVMGKTFPDVMDEKGYYIIGGIKHRHGANTLNVEVSDFSGNTISKTFSYDADLDLEQNH